MLGGNAYIPVAVPVVSSQTHIEAVSRDVRRGESRVVGGFGVHFRPFEALAQHSQFHAYAEHSPKQFSPVGVLDAETLVGEKSDIVTQKLCSDAMIGIHKIERHVATSIHRFWIVLKARKRHGVSRRHINLVRLSHRRRIKRRLQSPIVCEMGIILSHDSRRSHGKKKYYKVSCLSHLNK